jgi:tetratricopeptide (TPR) repeat protein
MANPYDGIGAVYYSMGDYSKALSYYTKALEIRQQSLPPNHPNLAKSYNNVGLVYENMGEFLKACSFYGRAVEIGQQSLPSTYPDLQN